MSQQTAITPTRTQDFPEWYQQVIKAADMAENSEVRGCMVIKPWGYAIWELIQKDLDQRFKDTGHTSAYLPRSLLNSSSSVPPRKPSSARLSPAGPPVTGTCPSKSTSGAT